MMWFRGFLLAVLVAGPAVAASNAEALAAGVDAFGRQDYATARAELRPMADNGSAIAETLMGVMAAKGWGGRADPAAAAAWWMRAANRGYAPAQLALAKALAKGSGVTANPGAAWVWAQLAAASGSGISAEAGALARELAEGFSAERLGVLEGERAAWRPWAG
ncbi:hypothetical protein GCM10011529_02030 [Polymorphobacter glacialis]|uniref:Sel1 repeat family protein n=1 Tax=Sandarakinorhabdus glacialis TaxID=1614636 RepID=A0A917E3H8_9SPHN|nr:hypothetical protein [Polymorphobacter glacialis]GGD99472.1 hypothetical protein GCM10011529_02030 [Polymorphobacter glacialis]